jgi:hypothetical protein
METRFLFPNKFKKFGIIATAFSLFIFFTVLCFEKELAINSPVFAIWSWPFFLGSTSLFRIETQEITGTITGILLLLSMTLAAFSREKNEDEYITKLRLESLVWSVFVNCAFILFSLFFLWGWSFAFIMGLNIYSILFLFILKFNFQLYRLKRAAINEK